LNDDKHKEVLKNISIQLLQRTGFTNLNLAYCKYGFFLKVPKNVVIEKPIHVFYISQNQEENTFYNTRNLLIVEEGAKEVIESHHNFDSTYVLTNSVTEIFTYPNAKADWHKFRMITILLILSTILCKTGERQFNDCKYILFRR
jgi:Fe-S cluster assembly protein SufD